ncbi:hypothetical protein AAES_120649 [Amazona aestiva]|uniref:Uncharacterized protein n=1 Tax=Amazona aestiva TaxID=12930 RepID=A0A0Q3PPY3_AMAAE|nr:hypothetical protein AAES_120649 [Amazona aestiva]
METKRQEQIMEKPIFDVKHSCVYHKEGLCQTCKAFQSPATRCSVNNYQGKFGKESKEKMKTQRERRRREEKRREEKRREKREEKRREEKRREEKRREEKRREPSKDT